MHTLSTAQAQVLAMVAERPFHPQAYAYSHSQVGGDPATETAQTLCIAVSQQSIVQLAQADEWNLRKLWIGSLQ